MMQVTAKVCVSSPAPYSFQCKATKFKNITGREIVHELDKNGDFVHMLQPESTQRLGFRLDFFRVGFNSKDGFKANLENLSRKYVDLRNEIAERYADDKDNFYAKLGQLNHTFEAALRSTLLLPLQQPLATDVLSSTNHSLAEKEAAQADFEKYEKIKNFMLSIQQNMARHLDVFFENFIKFAQEKDFETAFNSSVERLPLNTESLADISFSDNVLIFDTFLQGTLVKDEDENEIFVSIRPIDAIRSISSDTRISEVIRKELMDIFDV